MRIQRTAGTMARRRSGGICSDVGRRPVCNGVLVAMQQRRVQGCMRRFL